MSVFLTLDFVPLLAATLVALACGLLGNFLVLRQLALMGDAISHSVLPGIVAAFLLTSSRAPFPMFLGALAAGLLTVVFVEAIKRFARLDSGAAMGVAFSILFALGVALMQHASTRIDLDADCVLYGHLEGLTWPGPMAWSDLFHLHAIASLPRQVHVLALALAFVLVFIASLYKELRLAAFDAELSAALGFRPGLLHIALMLVVAAVVVASFEAVGSILVIAMLIGPASTARLLTNRLVAQIVVSVLIALATSVGGYFIAAYAPRLFGTSLSLNAAGTMAALSGILLALAILCSPSSGLIARSLRHRALSRRIGLDDLLATLYRHEEHSSQPARTGELTQRAALPPARASSLIEHAKRTGLVQSVGDAWTLTPVGKQRAADIIRRHRLWEAYLVEKAGLRPDHVHSTAEWLEHLPVETDPTFSAHHPFDPHGRPIPDPNTPPRNE